MSEPYDSESAPPDQSRKDSSTSAAQHGVATAPDRLWPFRKDSLIEVDGKLLTVAAVVLIDYHFMDGTPEQQKAVRTTIETRLKPDDSFVTWEDCANVKFREVPADCADIRITFKPEGEDNWYWSAVGTDAKNPRLFPSDKPTMKLAGLPSEPDLSPYHRGNILHEFGHVLGLHHEHQSPAVTGWLRLNEEAVINSEVYKGNVTKAKRNVLDRVKETINYTQVDEFSIMLYDIPIEWQKEHWWPLHPSNPKLIVSNSKLSDLDQAFIRLMYPPDLSKAENEQLFRQALFKAGVPKVTAGKVLNIFVANEGSLADRLTSVRDYFNTFKKGLSLSKFKPNVAIARGIDLASLKQFGVNEFIGEVTQNKLFQGIVKNIVYRAVEQYGIPTKVSVPGNTQNEVMKMLGALAMHDDVGHYIRYYDSQLSGKSDVPSSSKSQDNTFVKFEPNQWVEKALGFATAHVTKPGGGGTITVSLPSLEKKALFNSNESSVNFNSQDVREYLHIYLYSSAPYDLYWHSDVNGVLHYLNASNISTGKKAKWTPEWIVFYHGEWDIKNFTACFIPSPDRDFSETDLRSVNETFENVQWLPI